MLSPVRAGLAGADALNRLVQARFRVKVRELAEAEGCSRKVPRPIGPQTHEVAALGSMDEPFLEEALLRPTTRSGGGPDGVASSAERPPLPAARLPAARRTT